jgi:hypothetical protein
MAMPLACPGTRRNVEGADRGDLKNKIQLICNEKARRILTQGLERSKEEAASAEAMASNEQAMRKSMETVRNHWRDACVRL